MYGLINKAVEGLARSRFGAETWHRIRVRAGLKDEPFVSMEQYGDDVTYSLVAAASAELGVPAEAILEELGLYWVLYTAEGGYGDLLKTAGRTLPEFLLNLDQMHTRVQLSFPNLRPPSFAVRNATADSLELHYHSERAGLAPLVVGLLKGLGERFGLVLEITVRRVEGAHSYDAFDVRWREVAA